MTISLALHFGHYVANREPFGNFIHEITGYNDIGKLDRSFVKKVKDKTREKKWKFTIHLKLIFTEDHLESSAVEKKNHRIQSEHIYSLIYKSKRQTVCAII